MKLDIPSLDEFLGNVSDMGNYKHLMLITAVGALSEIHGDPRWDGKTEDEVWEFLGSTCKVIAFNIPQEIVDAASGNSGD